MIKGTKIRTQFRLKETKICKNNRMKFNQLQSNQKSDLKNRFDNIFKIFQMPCLPKELKAKTGSISVLRVPNAAQPNAAVPALTVPVTGSTLV